MRVRDLWIAAFLLALFAPAVIRMLAPERQGLGQELVTISGLMATALLVCTVILPGRLKSITRAFGIEAVLSSHRELGLATAVMSLAHLAFVVLNDPRYVSLALPFLSFVQPELRTRPTPLLNPLLGPPIRAQAAVLATAAMVVIVWWAARRQGHYERWRFWHLLLTVAALAGVALHVVLIGHLIPTAQLWRWILGDPIGMQMTLAQLQRWDPAGGVYLAVLALAITLAGIYRWLVRPFRRRARYRVSEVHRVDDSVSTIILRREGGAHADPLEFEPGQFAWLRLNQGPFTEEHPFTISSAAQDGHDIEFTIRHSGDWTSDIGKLGTGDFVWLDGPHGDFTPAEDTTGIVLIAAGVGITPAMSILRTLARDGDKRAIRLLLVGTPLFLAELQQLAAVLNLETHEMGRVRLSPETLGPLLPPGLLRGQHDYYLCGPPALLHDAVAALDALGVPQPRIHTEQFHS